MKSHLTYASISLVRDLTIATLVAILIMAATNSALATCGDKRPLGTHTPTLYPARAWVISRG
jgi:hypothetical protein